MQWRRLARFKASSSGGSTRARNMLCCGRRKENGRSVPDLTASPGRAPPPTRLKDQTPMVIQSDFRKVSGISSEIFRQIEAVENDHDATTAAALEAVERRGEMIVRILELRQIGRAANEAAKRFFALQDARHTVQLVEIVKRPGQTLGLYIREGNGMDRTDGVFISRIALESAVYNSGCLKVGDEILAVNLVDVTHMSLDDVVIIMSIPRRLVLATRQRKGNKGSGSPSMQAIIDHKANPVVVIKRELRDEDLDRVDEIDRGHGNSDYRDGMRDTGRMRHVGDGREMTESRSRLGLGLAGYSPDQTSNMDLYYNSRPPTETPTNHWSYQPPPPVITEQPKSNSAQHFQGYDRGYPKTLESLAEKVHSFYSGPVLPRRLSAGQPMASARFSSNQRIMPRSGSDQHLPRIEYSDYTSISPAGRHTLLRSSLKSGSTLSRYNQRYATTGPDSRAMSGKYLPSSISSQGTLTRRNRSLDYSSDTEATCGPSARSSYYYYNRNQQQPASVLNSISRTNTMLGTDFTSKFNSLPRDTRSSTRLAMGKRFGTLDRPGGISSLLLDEADGNISAPEMPHLSGRGTRDEYRSWLSRTPSTSAIYEQIRASRDVLNQHRAARFTYSAENIHDALKNAENAAAFSSSYGLYSGGRSALTGTLDRNLIGRTIGTSIPARSLSTQHITSAGGMIGSPSTRRMRQLLELSSRGGPSPVPTPSSSTLPRSRHIDINPSEFLKYKIEKSSMPMSSSVSMGLSSGGVASPSLQGGGVSGMLWLHLLAGRGLRGEGSTTPTGPQYPRDLYCVLECDRVHKARTVVRTGDLQFDWDESFELDLVKNRQLDLLVYSWDPQHRHKLCYRGAINLIQLIAQSPLHQLALKMEPRGTIYLRLRYSDSVQLYRRRPISAPMSRSAPPLFGAELDVVVSRETARQGPQAGSQPPIPLIIKRCVEEIERRGLDIIGLYRLCGSATKKRILRESFERNSRTVELTPDNVPDINVITGVLKDYLRELPQPLFTKCLYQMTVDALGVCLPDDPEGNAKLMLSILDCLPRSNRATLIFLLDHLAMVVSVSDRNKMSPENLATALAPPLMLHSTGDAHLTELDYAQPISVLKYLLQIWPAPKHSVRRGEPAPGLHGNRASASPVGHSTLQGQYQPSASPYLPAAVVSAASPVPLVRPSLAPSQVGHAQLSAKVGQYHPQSPRTGPLPVPPRSRQVIVSSPGSPSSSSDSQSGNETLKHGGSVSSIVRQPQPQPQAPTGTQSSSSLSQEGPPPPRPPSASALAQPQSHYNASPSSAMFTNGHSKSPRESPSIHRVSSPAHRTASPGIPGTNAGIAVTVNPSPFLTDLTSSSLTTMENTLISSLQSTINSIGTTTQSIYHHTTPDSINTSKGEEQYGLKSTIYGQKMPAVNSTTVSTVVASYATYGGRQPDNVFDTIGSSVKKNNSSANIQMSDIFGTGNNQYTKASSNSGYDMVGYSSTNPFLQNYSTDTIQEETFADVPFSSNLFTSRASANTDVFGHYKREEMTPSSSAGTEDSRHIRRDMQERDVEGDAEESE